MKQAVVDRENFVNDERLRKEERLLKRPQFVETRRRGKRAAGRSVVVYARPTSLGHPRLGLTVSRKVGNAVVRNRWKRRLRDIFRRSKTDIGSLDVVIIVKGGRRLPDYDRLSSDVLKTIDRAARVARRSE